MKIIHAIVKGFPPVIAKHFEKMLWQSKKSGGVVFSSSLREVGTTSWQSKKQKLSLRENPQGFSWQSTILKSLESLRILYFCVDSMESF